MLLSGQIKLFRTFKEWNIKIIMTDFIDRNDELAINFMHRFASECARNRFICMIVHSNFSRGTCQMHSVYLI
jgi:hypothetical protein